MFIATSAPTPRVLTSGRTASRVRGVAAEEEEEEGLAEAVVVPPNAALKLQAPVKAQVLARFAGP